VIPAQPTTRGLTRIQSNQSPDRYKTIDDTIQYLLIGKKVCGLTSHNGEVIQRRNLSGRFPLLGRGTQRPGIEPATFKLRVRRANHPTDRKKGSLLPLLHQGSAAYWQSLNTKQLSAHQCACEDDVTMTESNPVPRH